MNKLITICARGGSKGIPGKNTKMLDGKPLIYYSLAVANEFVKRNAGTQIILSTDSDDIKETVKKLAFSNVDLSYTRPDYLASDSAGKIDAIKDVLRFAEKKYHLKYDFLIDLDVTSPLRTVEDIEKAFSLLEANADALNIFSVNAANRNPYFNMVEEKEDGYVMLCKKGSFLTRQSAPKVYDLNASFYIYRADFFNKSDNKVITEKSLIYQMKHICFDLDHPIDFEIMSFLLENNKLDFELLR